MTEKITKVKVGLAQMLKGGVIMDVTSLKQAKIAEKAGAVSVMVLERVPADIKARGGVARMSDPYIIEKIMQEVSIPVMAKVRIGHFVEAQILEVLGVDYIDESEVLTPADNKYHIDKKAFNVPFVCGASNFYEALRRIDEGASLIRTKGEAGSGNIIEAVAHIRDIREEMKKLVDLADSKLKALSKEINVSLELLKQIALGKALPVPNFAAGGVVTPADAALLMHLGAEAIFVGSGIFKSKNPFKRACAIVQATTHFEDPKILAKISKNLGEPMAGTIFPKDDA